MWKWKEGEEFLLLIYLKWDKGIKICVYILKITLFTSSDVTKSDCRTRMTVEELWNIYIAFSLWFCVYEHFLIFCFVFRLLYFHFNLICPELKFIKLKMVIYFLKIQKRRASSFFHHPMEFSHPNSDEQLWIQKFCIKGHPPLPTSS